MKLKQAIDLDRKDNLKKYKTHFINSKKEIYLNGNSLGKLPIKSINKIRKTIDYEWGDRLVRSWNEKWLGLSENLEKKLSTILGATKREIKIGDSTSINLYQEGDNDIPVMVAKLPYPIRKSKKIATTFKIRLDI